MIGVALKGLLGRKLRAALTAFAIVLGVAMISGAFVLTDTLGKSFDGIYEESYDATDAVISSKVAIETQDGETEAPAFSAAVLSDVENLPGVRVAQGTDRGRGKPRRQGRRNDRAPRPGRLDGRRGDGRPEPQSRSSSSPVSGRAGTARSRSTARPQRSEHFEVGQTVGAYGDGPVEDVRDQRHRPLRVGGLAGRHHRSPSSTSRPPSGCSTRRASST